MVCPPLVCLCGGEERKKANLPRSGCSRYPGYLEAKEPKPECEILEDRWLSDPVLLGLYLAQAKANSNQCNLDQPGKSVKNKIMLRRWYLI